ncbi:hypothetical protein N9917_01425 [Deltaproteobacteria bacterium]|nr:hypothetical protein [Deltaproteobacteria bacterium]
MYVLMYVEDGEGICCPGLSMEEIEVRVLAMGLSPDEYCVTAGELIKDFDHPFHAWD